MKWSVKERITASILCIPVIILTMTGLAMLDTIVNKPTPVAKPTDWDRLVDLCRVYASDDDYGRRNFLDTPECNQVVAILNEIGARNAAAFKAATDRRKEKARELFNSGVRP